MERATTDDPHTSIDLMIEELLNMVDGEQMFPVMEMMIAFQIWETNTCNACEYDLFTQMRVPYLGLILNLHIAHFQ